MPKACYKWPLQRLGLGMRNLMRNPTIADNNFTGQLQVR
jgi:hypothetical protein